MKKFVLFIAMSAFLFTSCGKEKAFDENLQKSFAETGKVVLFSGTMCDQISRTWRNAIYENKDHKGNYCYDFNDALKTLFDDYREKGLIDSIEVYQNKMKESASLLNNPPKSRRDCYNDFIEIVSEASSLARMATDPSGSLQSYNNQVNETAESFAKKLDLFRIKYGEFLKK